MNDIFLRKMSREDLPQVLKIEEELFYEQKWNEEMFLHDLEYDYARYFSLFLKEDLIGYIGVYLLFPEMEISNVAITTRHQKKGYSHYLMQCALELAREGAFTDIFLEVEASNTSAIALYRRYGFQEMGIRRDYYGKGRDAFVMKLEMR